MSASIGGLVLLLLLIFALINAKEIIKNKESLFVKACFELWKYRFAVKVKLITVPC